MSVKEQYSVVLFVMLILYVMLMKMDLPYLMVIAMTMTIQSSQEPPKYPME